MLIWGLEYMLKKCQYVQKKIECVAGCFWETVSYIKFLVFKQMKQKNFNQSRRPKIQTVLRQLTSCLPLQYQIVSYGTASFLFLHCGIHTAMVNILAGRLKILRQSLTAEFSKSWPTPFGTFFMVHCPSISLNNVQISLEQIQKTTQICQNWAQMPYLRAMDIFFENSVPPFTIYNDSTTCKV